MEVFQRIVQLDDNGRVSVTLDNFDTSKLVPGKYTLMEQVFEVKDGKVNEQLIAEHVDNQDEKQTFKVTEPQLPETGSSISSTMLISSVICLFCSFIIQKQQIQHKRN